MAGPYGTALLDDFTRADAGTLGANWTADAFGFGLGSFSIVSNQASSGSGFHSNWWSAASFGADQEAYFTFVSATLGWRVRSACSPGLLAPAQPPPPTATTSPWTIRPGRSTGSMMARYAAWRQRADHADGRTQVRDRLHRKHDRVLA